MYYPYFRGKQFELILLRDNADFLANNNIHPIIEPVNINFSALTRAMKEINENEADCTLVVNPHAGQEPVSQSSILEELIQGSFKEYKKISLGYILDAKSDISNLVALLNQSSFFKKAQISYKYTLLQFDVV